MEKITALVQTYNAELHLDRVLKALEGFDELLVVDMESTDRTVEIARNHGARVVTVKRGEHRIVEAYREAAIGMASHPWVLVVDADEIVTPQLREYLYAQINADPTPRAYKIACRNYFMNRWMPCYYPDGHIRFMPRDGTHWPYRIHSTPSHQGPLVTIPPKRKELALIHLSNDSYNLLIDKLNTYTTQEIPRRRKSYRRYQMLTAPAFRFFKTYVLKGGWRCGMPGLIHAVYDGFYRFSALAKIEEERQLSRPSQLQADIDAIEEKIDIAAERDAGL